MDFSVLTFIEEEMAKVTPDMIEAQGRKLNDATSESKVYGRVFNDQTRKLWVCCLRFRQLAVKLATDSSMAVTDEETERLKSEAIKMKEIGEFVKDLFWIQLKHELDIWTEDTIGIRQGWQAVTTNREGTLHAALRQLFEGE